MDIAKAARTVVSWGWGFPVRGKRSAKWRTHDRATSTADGAAGGGGTIAHGALFNRGTAPGERGFGDELLFFFFRSNTNTGYLTSGGGGVGVLVRMSPSVTRPRPQDQTQPNRLCFFLPLSLSLLLDEVQLFERGSKERQWPCDLREKTAVLSNRWTYTKKVITQEARSL